MKRLVLFLSLIFSYLPISAQTLTATDARNLLAQTNPHDAQILLNLIYFSYVRSATTLAVQTLLFEHVQESWKLWLNSATQRRNPRTTLPYPETKAIDSSYAHLAYQTQAIANAIYLRALENSIEQESRLRSSAVKEYIEQARTEARNALAHTMVNAIVNLEQTFQAVNDVIELVHSKKFIRDLHELAQQAHDKNFITDGLDYLMNSFALQSFAQFDKKYLANSDSFFKMLAETQTIYSDMWTKLETTRANYYKDLYTTLYTTMTDLHFPAATYLCAFDETGYLTAENQTIPLPALLI